MRGSKIKVNIISNYVGRIWSFISIYIFVPFYLKILGIENYAVIGFYSVLLSLLAFADAGLTATLNREFAGKGHKDKQYASNLLRTFEYVYFAIIILIIGLFYFCSPFIVENYINEKTIPFDDLIFYVRIMGVIIALQFFSTMFQGGLMGLQEQQLSNILSIGYGFCRSGIVLIPLLIWSNLEAYFLWQLLSVCIYIFVIRYFLKNKLGNKNSKPNFRLFQKLWPYALGMMLMAMIGALNTQLDKILVSKLLPLVDFGYYSLAGIFAQIPIIIATPIMLAVFPVMTKNVIDKNIPDVKSLFDRYSFIIASVISVITFVLIFYANDLIYIWTGDIIATERITNISRILVMGGFFLALQLTSYYLALANSHTRTNIILGTLSIFFLLIVITPFIETLGLLGASLPWLISNFCVFILLSLIVIKKYLKENYFRWLFLNNILPIGISLIITFILYYIFSYLPKGYYTVFYSGVTFILACYVNLRIYNKKFVNHPILIIENVTKKLKKRK